MIDSRIQSADFDAGRQLRRLAELGSSTTASLIGLVGVADELSEVLVEIYPAMAKAELSRIAEEASTSWPLTGVILIHRHGRLRPGEQLFMAAVAALRAADAHHACTYLLEQVRARCPIWRKEVLTDGSSRWWSADA